MMKTPKAAKESPEAIAKREREELRADKANLSTTQDVLDGLTRRYSRRFGLIKGSGTQQNIVGGLSQLAGSAALGGASGSPAMFTGGTVYGGSSGGGGGGRSSSNMFADLY